MGEENATALETDSDAAASAVAAAAGLEEAASSFLAGISATTLVLSVNFEIDGCDKRAASLQYLALLPTAAGLAASAALVDGRVAAVSTENISRNFLRELREETIINRSSRN
jgi:hypothetical protein